MTLTPVQARELWANELESGNWKQGTGQLARQTDTGTEYCCLGVACELAVQEGIIVGYDGEMGALELYAKVENWLGLADPEGCYGEGKQTSLVSDNDTGATFEQIAATIRNEPEGLIA
jgi:hypothetical protein